MFSTWTWITTDAHNDNDFDKDEGDEIVNDEHKEYPLVQTFLERLGSHVGPEFGVWDCGFGVWGRGLPVCEISICVFM